MEELFRDYLKSHLSINLKEKHDYSGTKLIVELKLDAEVISSDYYTLEYQDD